MKNKYALFINNEHSYGPFNILFLNRLAFDESAEDPKDQVTDMLNKHLESEVCLVEMDGSVVATDLILESISLRTGNEPTIRLRRKSTCVNQW